MSDDVYECVSAEKQYDYVSGQVRYHNEKMLEAFYMFVRLFLSIVGGSFWLSFHPKITSSMAPTYAYVSDVVIVFVAAIATLLLGENLRAWYGYRKAQSRLGGFDTTGMARIPVPSVVRASVVEICMIMSIWIATFGFWYWNPFILSFSV